MLKQVMRIYLSVGHLVAGILVLISLKSDGQSHLWKYQYISPSNGKDIYEIYGAPFQDRYGLVWFTGAGVAGWYDGYTLHSIVPTSGRPTKLPGNVVNNYFEDKNGNTWAEGSFFSARFDRNTGLFVPVFVFENEQKVGQFLHATFLKPTSPTDKHFRIVQIDHENEVLRTISILLPDGSPLQQVPDWFANANTGRSFLCLNGEIFTAGPNDLDSVIVLEPTNQSHAVKNTWVKNILGHDKKGNVWAATADSRLAVKYHSTDTFALFSKIEELFLKMEGEILPRLMEDKDGKLWITTAERLYAHDPISSQTEVVLPRKCLDDGLIGNGLYSVFQHRGGEYWAGSVYGGTILTKIKSPFVHWNNPKDSLKELVYAVIEASDGTIWAGSRNSGLYHLDQQWQIIGFYPFQAKESISRVGGGVTSLLEDAHGSIWIGTYDMGLFRLDPDMEQPEPVRFEEGTPSKVFRATLADSKGNLWFARCNGISIWQPAENRFKHINLPGLNNADPCHHIFSLEEDNQGKVWVGQGHPIFYSFDPETETFETFQLPFARIFIQAIHFDQDNGNLWIGTLDHGLIRYSISEQKVVEQIDYQGDERLGEITAIMPDNHGFLWLATANGIAKMDKATRSFIRYGEDDGLGCTFFMTNAWHRGKKSRKIFFGCNDGLVAFHPDSISFQNRFYEAPLIFVSALVAGVETYLHPHAEKLTLQPGESTLEIRFASLDYRYPNQKKYSFYLENFDKTWGDTLPEPIAKYHHLQPGHYTFHLKATDSYGNWLKEERKLQIQIMPFWWQSWYFKALAAMTGLLSIFLAVSWYISRQKMQVKEREQALKRSSDEALLSALRNQMEPHFIFNSLNAANEYLSENDVVGANRFLSRFAQLMDLQMSDLRQHLVPFRQEQRFLELYLEIQHRRYRDKFDYKMDIDPSLVDLNPLIPSMLLQPFIENAIKHGLRPLPGKGLLSVRFEKIKEDLVCTVQDNGMGRPASNDLSSEGTTPPNHHIGLENVTKRIDLLNKLYRTQIKLSLEDLNPANHDNKGTKVTLRLKLNASC